jgi:23S rRNA pseudouridine1911/1915/1917 synthase
VPAIASSCICWTAVTAVEAEAVPLEILTRCRLVVLTKPPDGGAPGRGPRLGHLVNALLHHITDLKGSAARFAPASCTARSRTSGLLVVAKNDHAHQELSRQFQDREVEKEHRAGLGRGAGRLPDRRADRAIRSTGRRCRRPRRSREAVTRITPAFHMPGLTLCQVAIHTGRTHQIRVHLSAIGHPIVGDALYGGVHRRVAGDIRAVQRLQRPFLHSARLAFHHPRDGRRMEFAASLPPDLLDVLDALPGWADREEE